MKLIKSIIKISLLINAGPVCNAQSFLKIIIICVRRGWLNEVNAQYN